MCGWRRDVPGWLEARMPPVVWEVFVEEALTTVSIFPSSLTRRVRMSSSNTAIVLFRSAVGKEGGEDQLCFTDVKHNVMQSEEGSLLNVKDRGGG